MNVTFSIDDKVLDKARQVAKAQGKSLNQMVREYLQHFTAMAEMDRSIDELRQTSLQGHSRSWKFNRQEVYER